MGAQRLTASKEPTRSSGWAGAGVLGWCSTPNGIKGTYTDFLAVVVDECVLCSTPNGIKGTYTYWLRYERPVVFECSTPNGIKGTYTAQSPPPPAH